MSKLTPPLAHLSRTLLAVGIFSLAITANTLHPPFTSQNFVVTNTNDNGPGSLRDAINNANAMAGADTITFSVPGSGVKVINLQGPLPEITEQVVIDASTQPGYAGMPLVQLDGALAGNNSGLVITAGGSTVRGLAIVRFNGNGITLSGGAGNVIQGNFIGTDATGKVALGNLTGVSVSSANNLIGGTSAGAGNLISGNNKGIFVQSLSVITIQGNLIGTDITGTKAISNLVGIDTTAFSQNILIGGLVPGSRNVISGNVREGVIFGGEGSKLQGNFIGTDITGTLALGNGEGGVSVFGNALVGGTVPEARNVIAANGGLGNIILRSLFDTPSATVQGNYIGTDVTGSRALKPSNVGIFIAGAKCLIGGLVPGARNVISGNAIGILATSLFFPVTGTLIQGNLIGLTALGTGPLPNSEEGILISNASNNTIGGTQLEAANKIAFNGGAGIRLMSGNGNAIRGNSIFSNGGLGIDLDPTGVTANDLADTDIGPNNLQNFPVLTSVTSVGNSMTIQGSMKSTPNRTFQIDFYSSAALDSSGNGEGALFLHATTVNTNGSGDAAINETFPTPAGASQAVTATATDANGNTSEFSAGNSTGLIGSVQFSINSIQVHEDLGLLNVTVLRQGGSTGPLTVEFATTNGTAIAGEDYTSVSGMLSFASGETSKSFQIPILEDDADESNETFTVVLRNASIPEALGTPHDLLVTIQDRSRFLILEVNRPSLNEGGPGSISEMLFTMSLSAATSRTVSFDYATANQGAFGGVACGIQGIDYESTSGTATLQPGATSFTIPVKVCGDTSAESNETILINFSNSKNAVLFNVHETGTIVDDDVLELLHDDSGPVVDQAAALDAVTHLRDPFRLESIPEWLANGSDRNTRVVLFVRNLELNPGEMPSAVGVIVLGRDIVPAEDVRAVPNTDLTQIVFRLPNNLPEGFYIVEILAHGRVSNSGTIKVVQ